MKVMQECYFFFKRQHPLLKNSKVDDDTSEKARRMCSKLLSGQWRGKIVSFSSTPLLCIWGIILLLGSALDVEIQKVVVINAFVLSWSSFRPQQTKSSDICLNRQNYHRTFASDSPSFFFTLRSSAYAMSRHWCFRRRKKCFSNANVIRAGSSRFCQLVLKSKSPFIDVSNYEKWSLNSILNDRNRDSDLTRDSLEFVDNNDSSSLSEKKIKDEGRIEKEAGFFGSKKFLSRRQNKSYIHSITASNLAGVTSSSPSSSTNKSNNNQSVEGDEIKFVFNPNFVAVTGETGSGKSLLLRTACDLILGKKAHPNIFSVNDNKRKSKFGMNDEEIKDGVGPVHISLVAHLSNPHLDYTNAILHKVGLPLCSGEDELNGTWEYDGQHSEGNNGNLHSHNEDVRSISGVLRLERSITMHNQTSKSATLRSKCTINGERCSLKTLNMISSHILSTVDAASASTALQRSSKSRLSLLDCGVPVTIQEQYEEAKAHYINCKKQRQMLEDDLKQTQSLLSSSTMSLASSSKSDSSVNGKRDISMIQHWIDEIDDMKDKMMKYRQTLTETALSSSTGGKKKSDLYKACHTLYRAQWEQEQEQEQEEEEMRMMDNNERDTDDDETSRSAAQMSFYDALLNLRRVVKHVESQLDTLQQANGFLSSASSNESVITAVERVRHLLYDVEMTSSTNTPAFSTLLPRGSTNVLVGSSSHLINGGSSSINGDSSALDEERNEASLPKQLEHTHNILNDIEHLIRQCSLSIEDKIIEEVLNERQSIPVTLDDIDYHVTQWNALGRKHGLFDMSLLPKLQRVLCDELNGTHFAQQQLPKARSDEMEALMNLYQAKTKLYQSRTTVAERLSHGITKKWLPQLGMEDSSFVISVITGGKWKSIDEMNMLREELVSANNDAKESDKRGEELLTEDIVTFELNHRHNNQGYDEKSQEEIITISSTDIEKSLKETSHLDDRIASKSGMTSSSLIASSGEKARILLALETELPGSVGALVSSRRGSNSRGRDPTQLLLEHNNSEQNALNGTVQSLTDLPIPPPPVAVLYDEIDAHVGGRAVVAVAQMMCDQTRISSSSFGDNGGGQVICITHSTSVAAMADQHIAIEKQLSSQQHCAAEDSSSSSARGRNMKVMVRNLDNLIDRRKELARMASGDIVTDEAEAFADALLTMGREFRQSGRNSETTEP